MNNPYRAMCSELVEQVQRAINNHGLCLEASDALMHRARALLAEPDGPAVPDGREPASVAMQPSDEEIEEWADACPEAPLEEMDPEVHGWRRCFTAKEFSETIRAALSHWGRAAAAPVPVSERLPGDALCWWYEPDEDDDGSGYGGSWTLLRIRGAVSCYTHWLPANALPLPAPEGGESQP